MGYNKLEDLEVYILAEDLSNEIWDIVTRWDFLQKTLLANKSAGLQI
jgi:hypothetical protein